MDPFLEGQKWHDFHTSTLYVTRRLLTALLKPRYTVDIEESVYLQDEFDDDLRFPDISITEHDLDVSLPSSGGLAVAIEPVVYTVPKLRRARQRHLAVYSVDTRRLVTVMEVLSPTNKSSGYHDYLAKRDEIFADAVHLVELDLLRRGRRLPTVEQLHAADYYAFVSRHPQLPKVEVYGWTLREPLPSIPIPLKSGDPDVVLDLQTVLNTVYDESGYDASVDYEQAVVPALTPADAKWVQETLAAWRNAGK
jgi:hypothetical protein